ncbi:MAG: VWA domain-containing protein [Desulfamplus sp.]|nr:VWA domain-containing protein [Desulfamplus sp.]
MEPWGTGTGKKAPIIGVKEGNTWGKASGTGVKNDNTWGKGPGIRLKDGNPEVKAPVGGKINPSPGGATLVTLTARALPFLKYAALALMIAALARPQWGIEKINITTEGVNIILALDLSESMAALDFTEGNNIVTRLDAVKGVVNDFIMKRDGDRIAMVVFGSQAFTQIPLTRDYNAISFMLERLRIGSAGPSTAIGDAIGISLKRLEDIESKSNIIILLTDGRSNSGQLSPETAAEIAAQKGVKIHTIGVGTEGRVPFLVKDPLLGERYIHQRVDIDYKTLEKISDMTGGTFFAAQDITALGKIYEMIDALEKTEVEVQSWARYRELYPWLLLPAAVLVGLYILFSSTRFMRVP